MAFIPPQATQRKGSGFTNLSKVLEANKNNQLGSTIAGGLAQGAGQVQEGVQQAGQEFRQGANQNNLASTANISARQQAISNILAGGGNELASPDTIKDFNTYRAGVYKGPQELDATKATQLGGKAKELQTYGQQLKGPDKTQVLQAYVAPQTGNYNLGEKRLDNMLLGNSPQKNDLMRAGRQTSGLSNVVSNEQAKARALAGMRTGEAKQFGEETKGMLGTATGGIEKNITDLTNQYGTQQADKFNQYKTALGKRAIYDVPELRGLLNQATYGIDPTQGRFLSQENAPTTSSVANQQQFAQLQALAKLSGQQGSTFLPQLSETAYDPSKAVSFNEAAFKSAVKNEGQPKFQQATQAPVNTRVEGEAFGPLPGFPVSMLENQIPNGPLQEQMDYVSTPNAEGKTWEDIAREKNDQTALNRIARIKKAYQGLQQQYGALDTFNR